MADGKPYVQLLVIEGKPYRPPIEQPTWSEVVAALWQLDQESAHRVVMERNEGQYVADFRRQRRIPRGCLSRRNAGVADQSGSNDRRERLLNVAVGGDGFPATEIWEDLESIVPVAKEYFERGVLSDQFIWETR